MAIGAWLSLTDPAAAEILGSTGFDYLIIDTEHGAWDLQPLQTAIMALNGTDTVPIVRAPWNDHVRIKQLLDLGVEGILAPMVRTVEECRDLVAACRYPPVGRRGFGPRRASNYYRDIKTYEARANEAIFVMPQIEDIATLDVLDDFLDVPGIDAVAIGPNDMSGTAGLFRDANHPTILRRHRHDRGQGVGAGNPGLPRGQHAAAAAARLGRQRRAAAARHIGSRASGRRSQDFAECKSGGAEGLTGALLTGMYHGS